MMENYNPSIEEIEMAALDTYRQIVDEKAKLSSKNAELINEQETRHPLSRGANSDYSVKWSALLKFESNPSKEYFAEHLRNNVLVDLGCGARDMERVARELQARMYIGVDRYPLSTSQQSPLVPFYCGPDINLKKEIVSNMQTATVCDDMLDFVSRLKSGSCNFTINGIDSIIIPSTDYHQALMEEIIRATSKGGLVFGSNSVVLDILEGLTSKESSFKQKIFESKDGLVMDPDDFCFEKI